MGHPEMVSHGDSFTGFYLEFLLGRHDFRICPVDSGVQYPCHRLCLLPHYSNVDIRAWGSHWKAKVDVCPHESMSLLHSEPGVLVAYHVHYPFTGMSKISLCRLLVILENFTEHQFIGVFVEEVPKCGNRDKVHATVGAFR